MMTETQIKKIKSEAFRVAEENLASGNWKLEAAYTYLKGAEYYPEMYAGLLMK